MSRQSNGIQENKFKILLFVLGVYGMWNVYICAMLMLYAPSHKKWPAEPMCSENAEEVEFSRLPSDSGPSEISSLTSFASKATID